MRMPVVIGDYTDFYASRNHATNVGRMFRPTGIRRRRTISIFLLDITAVRARSSSPAPMSTVPQGS